MSLADFWLSVRIGARLITPSATVDSPRLDAGKIEQTLRAADLWLTPKCVEGFEEGDFSFLPDPEREELTKLVAQFRAVASQVPPDGPATQQQVEEALPCFLAIVRMLEFDRFGDDQAYRIGKQVERQIEPRRPAWLQELRFDTGADWAGDPSLWIWCVVADEAAQGKQGAQNARMIRELLDRAARVVARDRWPYIRFRTVSEQAEIQEGAPA